jgi:hypothetical protein
MQRNNSFVLVRFEPWMAAQTARFVSFEVMEEQYLAPLPPAEER